MNNIPESVQGGDVSERSKIKVTEQRCGIVKGSDEELGEDIELDAPIRTTSTDSTGGLMCKWQELCTVRES